MKKPSLEQFAMSEPADEVQGAVVEIGGMGALGQGIAHARGGKHFIPFVLPGERVRIEWPEEKPVAAGIETPSPERAAPVCKHFGACGGCSLQHWAEAPYQEWKKSLVTAALSRAGLEAEIGPLTSYPAPSRRRAAFTARMEGRALALGYNAARSHDIINLEECPILLPAIAQALPQVRTALAAGMPSRSEAKIAVTAAVNGLDCFIEGPALHRTASAMVMDALQAGGFVRAMWNGELLMLAAAPYAAPGGVNVTLPPNAFLQAVEACERDMADWAIAELGPKPGGPVCDLFAGLGAFTFAAATLAPVTAYEDSQQAVDALTAAAKRAPGRKAISAVRRDLYRNPLGPLELNKFAAAIIDPPREGAEAQARTLAASKIATVVMLSCNPASFARDAAILAGGGFKLARLAAFDQFRYSAHVEIAALFTRAKASQTKKGGLSPALKR
jgi:23S rRNA (uracil1939-C5)-methyltransferase